MKPLRVFTATEQVATYLREQIIARTWVETMPGTAKLAGELGVGMRTVSDALDQLEKEGLLVNQGRRRKRRIVVPDDAVSEGFRVGILLYDKDSRDNPISRNLKIRLSEAGFQVDFCDMTLLDMKMDVKQVSESVQQMPSDAWIINAGSREVLEWFSKQSLPYFAIGGPHAGQKIAATSIRSNHAMTALIKRLYELGHRRIVFLTYEERLKSASAKLEEYFIKELEARGIKTGLYNLPKWSFGAEGLRGCLDSLFRVTPPTAIFCMDTSIYHSVQQYLSQKKIVTPQDVSLVCNYDKSEFALCITSVAHLTWDTRKLSRAAIKWVNKVARGKDQKTKTYVQAEFIDGGTIGPPPS